MGITFAELIVALAFFCVTAHAQQASRVVTVDGYVTSIGSSSSFDIGNLEVHLRSDTRCSVRILASSDSPFESWKPSDSREWVDSESWVHSWKWVDFWKWTVPGDFVFAKDSKAYQVVDASCNKVHLSVASAVHVTGVFEEGGRGLAARSVAAIQISEPSTVNGFTLSEEKTAEADQPGGAVNMWLDGYPMLLASQDLTIRRYDHVVYTPTLNEDGTLKTDDTASVKQSAKDGNAKQILQLIPYATWIRYVAKRRSDGMLAATDLSLYGNNMNLDRDAYRSLFEVSVETPNYSTGTNGNVRFHNGKASILPDASIQDWITAFGSTLIPQPPQPIDTGQSSHIHFRFYVIRPFVNGYLRGFTAIDGENCETVGDNGYMYSNPKPYRTVHGIIALQDGTILVPINVLKLLHNT